jgi:hypothetical protein
MKKAFHIVYTILALNFLIPVIIYAINPAGTILQFTQLGTLLGSPEYFHSEDSVFWRVLAIANVTTLGFCCILLQVNLKKWFPCLVPLVFLKSMAAFGFLVAFTFEHYSGYLAGTVFDSITVGLMWFFATRAHKEISA